MLGKQNWVDDWDRVKVFATFLKRLVLYLLIVGLVIAEVLITVLLFKQFLVELTILTFLHLKRNLYHDIVCSSGSWGRLLMVTNKQVLLFLLMELLGHRYHLLFNLISVFPLVFAFWLIFLLKENYFRILYNFSWNLSVFNRDIRAFLRRQHLIVDSFLKWFRR